MKNAFEVLKERGFIEQFTHEEEIKHLFANEKITFYIGIDPTADSLHLGHFMTILAMHHLQQCGHRPIVLAGGGTAMIGDPSGKTDMRRMMTVEEIDNNVDCIKKQLSRFIDFGDDKAIMVNNGDWLRNLNYMDFIREIGTHFSVNRMLTADAFKTRFEQERGLSFLEFNYMIMQSYDFYELNKRYGCNVQLGGNDQWSNIIAGVDLIRRKEGKNAYGMTFKLLVNSEGTKMGKTEKGALWLDPEKTSPYEFFQYMRNIDDQSVGEFLGLLTYLPMEEVRELAKLEGNEINKAKEILAFELTKIVHGEEAATQALNAARSLFAGGGDDSSMPKTTFAKSKFENGEGILNILTEVNLLSSKSEARRLITQGGLKLNDVKIDDVEYVVTLADFVDGEIKIQKGKKSFHKIIIE